MNKNNFPLFLGIALAIGIGFGVLFNYNGDASYLFSKNAKDLKIKKLMQFIEKYLSFSLFSFLLIQSGKSKSLIFLLLHIFEFSPCVMLVLKNPRIIALPLLVSDRLISLLILEILLVRLHLQIIHILLHHHHIVRSVLLLLHICD